MDAKQALARYLEQRVELGEHDLVLQEMSRGQALASVGQTAGVTRSASTRAETTGTQATRPSTSNRSADRTVRESPPQDADWRATLAASDAAPPAAAAKAMAPIARPLTAASGAAAEQSSLAGIAALVAGCTLCALHATARNPVPGEGNPNADLMFVGEAPGETEDETGRPFIGRAGQLLTKIIEAIEMKREDVFICNVLKHRPPANRNPTPDEVRVCSPYLLRQIDLVKPKVIVALGTFAAQTLLDTKTSIGKLRGSVHRYHGVPLIVTYHPAALLRNPAWKRPTWEDIQLARRILESSVSPAVPIDGA